MSKWKKIAAKCFDLTTDHDGAAIISIGHQSCYDDGPTALMTIEFATAEKEIQLTIAQCSELEYMLSEIRRSLIVNQIAAAHDEYSEAS